MSTRRTQQERSTESRRRLISAATELLATRGYSGTSLASIGTHAGLSRGLVTHHFGSKEQCIAETVNYIRQLVADEIEAEDLTGIPAIESLLHRYLDERSSHSIAARAILAVMVEALTASPGLLPTVADHNLVVREYFFRWIRDGQSAGEIRADIDPEAMSVVIEGIMRGVILQVLLDPERIDRAAVVETGITAIRAALTS